MKKPVIYYLIFALSGFSGLIYESIWTHYLKLFLGHAAYAQTLVLAIFMGGMALGAYICSKYSFKWKNLLYGYALVEGIVGLAALAYHPLFDAGVNYSYSTIFPLLSSQAAINIFKWGFSTLSILPQSMLLGMTFPLMSGAFLRLFPERSGSSLAILYFANSIGAVFGVLASGFIFIDLVGFPGTISFAGIINIALAITVWVLSRHVPGPVMSNACPDDGREMSPEKVPSQYRLLLLIAFGTGAASFMYEIGWIRMLALVLGSSTHAFELMLSAFLLGLASGGIWIKRRIDTLKNPIRFLAFIQIAMGIAALATLPLYNRTFPIMQWLVKTLPKTDLGYIWFNLGSYGIASAIMLPATFCAGMTLPLITNILFRNGYGEKSIGAVYAANTVGAIIGIFSAVHLVMPSIGLKGLLTSGAAVDMMLAVIIVACAVDIGTKRLTLPFAGACTVTVILAILFVHLDQYKMASGVYRASVKIMTPENISLLFHKDGKTATISVAMAKNGDTNIITNGKSDSAININPLGSSALDESTTILCAALPFFYNPKALKCANIGLGTGLTTQTILTNPNVQRVDTIEIEKAVIEGAQQFRSRTNLVYSDPRSSIIIDDAKSVISSNRHIYDIIISEPSNPWVSGVASLFSEEFYHHIRNRLQDEGLFVQWIQLYESDMYVLASVFKALSKNFSDYSVYLTGGNADLMVVAKKNGSLGPLNPAALQLPEFSSLLARININGLQDIRIREIGSKKFLDPLFQSYPIRANSDYFPVLDQRVGKTKFMDTGAFSILQLAGGRIPYLPYMQLITNDHNPPAFHSVTVAEDCGITLVAKQGISLRNYILTGKFTDKIASDERITAGISTTAVNLRKMLLDCSSIPETDRRELLSGAAIAMIPYLTAEELKPVWDAFGNQSCRAGMSSAEKRHIEFYRAVSARDFKRVAVMARELLANDSQLSQNTRQYIVGVAMLASIAAGNRADARELYQQVFGAKEQTDITFRLLYAQSKL
jgi:spermidine synthase